MRRRRFLRAALPASVGLGTVLAGCGGARHTPTPPTNGDVLMTTSDNTHYFDPVGLFVEPGETVVWTSGKGIHSTAAFANTVAIRVPERRIPEGAEAWYSGALSEFGETMGWTFEVEGTYDVLCNQHKQTGELSRIVVGEPGGPADGPMTPYGPVPEADRIVEEGVVSYDDFVGD